MVGCLQGMANPRGQSNLATMYLVGDGIPRDETKAEMWMRKAAEQGFASGQFGLGSMYAHGQGVPKNESEAVTWYRKAADQGNAPAMNNLAVILDTSNDPKIRNKQEALKYAQKSVELEPNNASYLDTLADAYFEINERDKAVEIEERALALKPEQWRLQICLTEISGEAVQ